MQIKKIDTYQRVTASHARFSLTKPINRTSWTYLLQVHGIIGLIVTFGRIPVVLQLSQLETLALNDCSGLTQTPRNLI